MTEGKEGEKCRLCEEHRETTLAAVGDAGGDQLERKVKEVSVSQLPLRYQIPACLLIFPSGFSSYLEKHK